MLYKITIKHQIMTTKRKPRSDENRFYAAAEHAERKNANLYLGPPMRKPDSSGNWICSAYGENWVSSVEIVIEHSHQAGFFWRRGKMGASIHTGWREFSGVFMKIIARRTTA